MKKKKTICGFCGLRGVCVITQHRNYDTSQATGKNNNPRNRKEEEEEEE